MSTVVALRNRTLADIENDLRVVVKRRAKDTIAAGGLLIEAREHLTTHGEWLPWLDQNFGLSERTARHWMTASTFVEAFQIGNVADLKIGLSTIYFLGSRMERDPSSAVKIIELLAVAKDRHVTKAEAVAIFAEADKATAEAYRAAHEAEREAKHKAKADARAARNKTTTETIQLKDKMVDLFRKITQRHGRKAVNDILKQIGAKSISGNAAKGDSYNFAVKPESYNLAIKLCESFLAADTSEYTDKLSADALRAFEACCKDALPKMNADDKANALQIVMRGLNVRATDGSKVA